MVKESRPEAATDAHAAVSPRDAQVAVAGQPLIEKPVETPPPARLSEPSSVGGKAVDAVAPDEAVRASPLRHLQRLHGLTSSFWRDQLQRSTTTGQAMLLCRSPLAALGLQVGYVQASLAAGMEHAGEVARLSQDIARDMLPGR